ncbi:MAG: glycosyltransferase [Paramuribaculum sp.]|nr:glycosyltransferase [Paramuribaculum sp.]
MSFFSVITCLYNAERYLEKGLNCLLTQKFRDYEIILIDDGSTDFTPVFCDKMVNLYDNIKVIHQVNMGPGEARNRGIKLSSGKYICFFDIDDTVDENWLDKIYNNLILSYPEVLIYSYREINLRYGTQSEFHFNNLELISNYQIGQSFTEHLSGLKFNNGFVWNKVYDRKFISDNNILFPSSIIQQDELFNHNVYRNAHHIVLIDEILYDYYVYYNGNIRSRMVPQRFEIFKEVKASFLNLVEFWRISDRRMLEYIDKRFLLNTFFNIGMGMREKQLSDYLLKTVNDVEVSMSLKQIKNTKKKGFTFSCLCWFYENKNLFMIKLTYKILNLISKLTYIRQHFR